MATKNTFNIIFVGNHDLLAGIEIPEGAQLFVTESLSRLDIEESPLLLICDATWLESCTTEQHKEVSYWADMSERWLLLDNKQISDNRLIDLLQLGANDVVSRERISDWLQQFISHYNTDYRGKALWHLSKSGSKISCLDALNDAGIKVSSFASLHEIPANSFPSIILCSDVVGLVLAKNIITHSAENIPVIYLADTIAPPQSIIHHAISVSSTLTSEQLVAHILQTLSLSTGESLPYNDHLIQALNEHAIVSLTDLDGNITYVNDRFCDISGYNRNELIGKNHRLLKSGLIDDHVYQDMWSTLKEGNTWHGVLCNRKKKKGYYWVEATIMPHIGLAGEPIGYCSIRTDITALKNAEHKLHRHAEIQRQSQSFANVGTLDLNILTGDLYWSEQTPKLLGYAQGEDKSSYSNFIQAVHPDDRNFVEKAILNAIKSNTSYEIEHRVVWANGQERWLQERGAVTVDDAGKPDHMLGVVQDIHERKLIEMELMQSQATLAEANAMIHQVLNTIPDRVFWKDRNHRYLGGNQAFCRDVGINNIDELIGLTDTDIPWSASKADQYYDINNNIMNNDQPMLHYEECQTTSSGKITFTDTSKMPLKDASGNVIGLLGVYQDITESHITQQRLKENEERLSLAIEGSGDGVWDWNMTSGMMKFSRLYMEMLGFEEFELPHHQDTWLDSLHPDDIKRTKQYLEEYIEGVHSNYNIQLRLRCKNGDYKWILCRGIIVERAENGEPQRMIGIHSDINEQKLLETRLNLFKLVFDSSDQCILITDENWKVAFANHAYINTLKITASEVVNHDIRKFVAKDDEITDVIMDTLLVKKQSWTGLTTRVRADDSEFVTTNSFGITQDSSGNVANIFVIFSDYSQELNRRKELASAKEEAETANNAKSEFLSNMSHELRTPMNAVIGFAQLLECDLNISSDQKDNIKEILQAGRHLLDLINDVLDLSKVESGQIDLSMETINLNELIQECYDLTLGLATQRRLTFTLSIPKNQHVHADRVRLKQVLLNLISNAIKYNYDEGRIDLSIQVSDGISRISITDSGPGISNERIEELYQPFNRLDADLTDIEGTGIGLTITRRLIELMEGKIGVDSTLGQGSTFWIELPVSENNALDKTDNFACEHFLEGAANNIGQHTVLCIDDNPANLKLIELFLSKLNSVQVTTAQKSELGIEKALADKPDLILLDINMPGKDGYKVLQELRSHSDTKDIPIIAVTASAMPNDIERGLAAGFSDYLTKPIDLRQTLTAVNKWLPSMEIELQDS